MGKGLKLPGGLITAFLKKKKKHLSQDKIIKSWFYLIRVLITMLLISTFFLRIKSGKRSVSPLDTQVYIHYLLDVKHKQLLIFTISHFL